MQQQQRHLMLDIETLGTRPGCVVLSIGAVEFLETGELLGQFHAHVDIRSAADFGLTIESDTVMWWLDQDKAAQNALLAAERATLHDIATAFCQTFDWHGLKVWANGASFDFPILKAAFDAIGYKLPWAFYNEMDYRTLKNLVPKEVFQRLKVEPDIAHDALSDAAAQARTMVKLMHYLRGEPEVIRAAA